MVNFRAGIGKTQGKPRTSWARNMNKTELVRHLKKFLITVDI